MNDESDRLSRPIMPNTLNYQPQPRPRDRVSRIAYGICAGICWFGFSLVVFADIGIMIQGKIKIEQAAFAGVAAGFLLPAIYFTRKAAR